MNEEMGTDNRRPKLGIEVGALNFDVGILKRKVRQVKAEELKTKVEELVTDLSSLSKDVSNLKELSKVSKTEKIMTVKDEPVKCKNCKTDPCLKGKLVTLGNFAELANCKDEDGDCGYIHMHKGGDCRYPNMQSEKRYFKYEHGGPFPLEHVKSLRYSC